MDTLHSAIIDMVETAYAVDLAEGRWLPRLLEAGLPAVDQGLGLMGVSGTRSPDGAPTDVGALVQLLRTAEVRAFQDETRIRAAVNGRSG